MALRIKPKVNRGIEEVAEIVISLLTKKQLSILEVVVNRKRFSFKEKLILQYRKKKPKYSRLETRFHAASIIKSNQSILNEKISNHSTDVQWIDDFSQQFGALFTDKYEALSKFIAWIWSNKEQIIGFVKGIMSMRTR